MRPAHIRLADIADQSEQNIGASVRRALLQDPLVAVADIRVHVERGAVVLMGEVGSISAYMHAQDIARGVLPLSSAVWNCLRLAAPGRPRKLYWRPSRPAKWAGAYLRGAA